MDNLKLPIALVLAMAVQLTGGVWWVSQQAATIASLEETVSQLGSRMAIEDNVNLKRDVAENAEYIKSAFKEIDELWDEVDGMMIHMNHIVDLQQRVALMEQRLEFMRRTDPSKADMR